MTTQQKKGNGKNIGVAVALPEKTCEDKRCPFHGNLKLHGRIFSGEVVKDIFHKTVTIEFKRTVPIKKYERTEKRRSRIKAHVPPCMNIKKGDRIRVMETKPISKTKTFVTIEVMKK